MWEIDYEKAASVWLEKDKDSVHMKEDALKDKIDEFRVEFYSVRSR